MGRKKADSEDHYTEEPSAYLLSTVIMRFDNFNSPGRERECPAKNRLGGPLQMLAAGLLLLILFAAPAVGCGTYVPEIQEFPLTPGQGQLMVQRIVLNVTCEIQNAVYDVINEDKQDVREKRIPARHTAWLDGWGVQATLILTIDESAGINPTENWIPHNIGSHIFNLGAGLNLSSAATRIDKTHAFYSVDKLSQHRCVDSDRPGGAYLMQSDLKLKEWLYDNVQLSDAGEIGFPSDPNGPFKQDVISHEVKFVITTNGNITPGLKLRRVSLNQAGSFLSAGRVRTHDLLITLGPTTKNSQGQTVPTTAAQNSHFASEISAGIAARNNSRNNSGSGNQYPLIRLYDPVAAKNGVSKMRNKGRGT